MGSDGSMKIEGKSLWYGSLADGRSVDASRRYVCYIGEVRFVHDVVAVKKNSWSLLQARIAVDVDHGLGPHFVGHRTS
jgi:hypothetical protein